MHAEQTLETPPRLLADAMLGKLARWLRVLGYDTRYLQGDDAWIAHEARADDRVLLTRDRELARRRGLKVILVQSQSLHKQLAQVVASVGAPPEGTTSRCMACNVSLRRLSVEEARPDVPRYVAQTQRYFCSCPKCGKIYWRGTHWEGIEGQIEQALADLV